MHDTVFVLCNALESVCTWHELAVSNHHWHAAQAVLYTLLQTFYAPYIILLAAGAVCTTRFP